ncbi:MAG: hypothetical protein ACKV22_32365, partial [Bryobacteraceae bacterium]
MNYEHHPTDDRQGAANPDWCISARQPWVGDTLGAHCVRRCKKIDFANFVGAWGDAKSLVDVAERVVGRLARSPGVEKL